MQNALNITMMGGKRLPYDAEVEYLESTGTQYVNTGLTLEELSLIEIDLQYTSTTAPDGKAMQNGAVHQIGSLYNHLVFTQQDNSLLAMSGTSAEFFRANTGRLDRHIVKFNIATGVFSFDSTTRSFSFNNNFNNITFCLFARNLDGTIQHYCREKIYGARFVCNDGTEHLLKPVRLNNTGYLCDTATAQLLGTGAFIIGPDVNT